MRRFPDVLPGASYPGYALSPASQVRRSDMEAGEARVRRITRARRDMISASWIFTDAEMGAFRTWYDDLPVSLAGDSDDLSGWGRTEMSAPAAGIAGPDGCVPSALVPTTVAAAHSTGKSLPALVADGEAVVATVTLASGGIQKARLRWIDRSGASLTADVDLVAGQVLGTPGFPVTVVERAAGWWRLTATLSTGTGGSAPWVLIHALDASGAAVFAGNGSDGLLACEVMVRRLTCEADALFVRSGADGRALGADGGAGWFQMLVPLGGGLSVQDCRFVDVFDGRAGAAMEWTVQAKVEVRHA